MLKLQQLSRDHKVVLEIEALHSISTRQELGLDFGLSLGWKLWVPCKACQSRGILGPGVCYPFYSLYSSHTGHSVAGRQQREMNLSLISATGVLFVYYCFLLIFAFLFLILKLEHVTLPPRAGNSLK